VTTSRIVHVTATTILVGVTFCCFPWMYDDRHHHLVNNDNMVHILRIEFL
jgi:hypothetical protein